MQEYCDYIKEVHISNQNECANCRAVEKVEVDVPKVMAKYDELLAAGSIKEAGEFMTDMAMFAEGCGEALSAASFLNELAGYWRVHGNKEKSYASCKKALAMMRGADKADTIDYATMLLNYATAMNVFGDFEDALKIYGEVDLIYGDNELGAKDFRRASLLNNIAQLYMKLGKFSDALSAFESSYDMLLVNDDVEVEKATCLVNMAFCLTGLRKIEQAQEKIAAAEKIYATLGDEPHYDSLLVCKGQLCYIAGKYAEAAELFATAAANTERRFGKTPEYAVSCKNAARCFEAAGMEEKAKIYAAMALVK